MYTCLYILVQQSDYDKDVQLYYVGYPLQWVQCFYAYIYNI